MPLHPHLIEIRLMGVAIRNIPMSKWVVGRQRITRSLCMTAAVALKARPNIIGMLRILLIHRTSCCGIDRHAKDEHQPLQTALRSHAVQVISIGPALCLKQALCISPVALMCIKKICLHISSSLTKAQVLQPRTQHLGGGAGLRLWRFALDKGQHIDQQGTRFEEVRHLGAQLIDDDLHLGVGWSPMISFHTR